MTTKSWTEAKALLETKRALLIDWGRYVMFQLLEKNGTVHSQEIIRVLKDMDVLEGYKGKNFWVGAVFSDARLEKTGKTVTHSEGGSHERTNPVWRLRAGFKGALPEAPDVKPLFGTLPDDIWSEERYIMSLAKNALADCYEAGEVEELNRDKIYNALKHVREYLVRTEPKVEEEEEEKVDQ